MGIFGKKSPPAQRAPSAPAKAAPPAGGLSIVGAGMLVRGDLESNGVVKVEGIVEGHVRARGQVLVAKEGAVHGDIETIEAVVGGTVSGAIRATERVEVQAGASVEGDITTRRISVAEGGTLNGLIRMDVAPEPAEEKAASKPAETETPVRAPQPAGPSRPSSVPVARIAMPPRAAT